MQSPVAASPIRLDVERIRELSKGGRHYEALAAAEVLSAAAPHDRDVLYLIATNLRCLNRIDDALVTLQRLQQHHPRFSLLYQEQGYCYTTLRDTPRAIDAFLRAVDINPALVTSWIMLDRLYRLKRDEPNAAAVAERVSALKRLAPEVVQAGSLFSDGQLSAAENILRAYLFKSGDDAEALRLLGRIEHQRDGLEEAELLLETALKLAPNYLAARLDYVRILVDRQKYLRAREEIDTLLKLEPDNQYYLSLSAAACVGLGEYEQGIALYRRLLAASPGSADLQLSLGHTLKTVGRQKEATESYQMAVAARPSFGDAWWSLANLKTYRFSQNEIAQMRTEEAASETHLVDRYHLCFALGKAFEDRSEYAESWHFYERGNALKRAESRYHPEITEANTRQQIEVCTAQFFAARLGVGAPDPDPIFIVGLPRSGSTLVEQILASHSQVEGTQELSEIQRIALAMRGKQSGLDHPGWHPGKDNSYPGVLAELAPEDFRRLGERFLRETRAYRTDNPFFIDKMPNNFRHLGLIHLMLPNARIIDARREPMACCLGNLKQLFASGQEFTYSIGDIARYYRTYLELMRHWDAVLPGRILRVRHEDVVEDLEGNVRSVLEFCGLEFEPACVEFYKTQRSVRTASSEQVRQPIFRDGLSQWRNYEPWLGPLKDTLGDALIRYRD
ncbi:MAG TPA: sulfotransferase [Candidatus Acidoferrales bacterium]|jgi:tetratricopeptide (TPR) repeat protein|nr:sulfotransferase [Candidatus Acidoferrales bacterium]